MKDVLIYTVHKAASMFLHQLAAEISKIYKIDYYSINQKENFDEIKGTSWLSYMTSENRHGCFGPIRAGEAEPNIPENLEKYSVIVHLRDPRDVLVSLFYSHIYSHPSAGGFNVDQSTKKQWEKSGVDKFVLERAPTFLNYYNKLYSELIVNEHVVFIKYEAMVLEYGVWLKSFLSAFEHFEIPNKSLFWRFSGYKSHNDIYDSLYKKHVGDFVATTENVSKHKRQITPGDYKRKLASATIDELNEVLGDVLLKLKYF